MRSLLEEEEAGGGKKRPWAGCQGRWTESILTVCQVIHVSVYICTLVLNPTNIRQRPVILQLLRVLKKEPDASYSFRLELIDGRRTWLKKLPT